MKWPIALLGCLITIGLVDLLWVTDEWYRYFGYTGYFIIGWLWGEVGSTK